MVALAVAVAALTRACFTLAVMCRSGTLIPLSEFACSRARVLVKHAQHMSDEIYVKGHIAVDIQWSMYLLAPYVPRFAVSNNVHLISLGWMAMQA